MGCQIIQVLIYLYIDFRDVWCRGSTTCLLHVGPPSGNRFLNTSWSVGLTYWIVYLHYFCILTYAIIYWLSTNIPIYRFQRRLVSWINHLPPACWSTFWKSIFKHQLGCRFDILDSIFSLFLYFDICNYICLDTSYHFWLYLYFLNILYFLKYSGTNIFHRLSLSSLLVIIPYFKRMMKL